LKGIKEKEDKNKIKHKNNVRRIKRKKIIVMTSMASRYFSLTDIESLIGQQMSFKLPDKTKTLLAQLEQDIKLTVSNWETAVQPTFSSSSSSSSSSSFSSSSTSLTLSSNKMSSNKMTSLSSNKLSVRYKKTSSPASAEDWKSRVVQNHFQTTKFENKEGIDKKINEIRILLNKISLKNYEAQKTLIVAAIADYVYLLQTASAAETADSDSDSESDKLKDHADMQRLSQTIFDIVSTNKFFSELYASLYKELIASFHVFREILDTFVSAYKTTVETMHAVDPNTDYDGFCAYTKSNDNRKATTLFLVNMFKNEVLSIETVIDLGCNVGLFPLYLCAIGGRKNFRGVLVDGNPLMIAEARENLRLNGLLGRFELAHGIAGGPAGTTQTFCITQNTMSSTMHGEILGSQIGVKHIAVPVVDVFAIFAKACPRERCDLLKIDIEGCELQFLRDNSALLAMTERVVVEFHKHACSYAEIRDLLASERFVAGDVVDDPEMPWGVAYFRKGAA